MDKELIMGLIRLSTIAITDKESMDEVEKTLNDINNEKSLGMRLGDVFGGLADRLEAIKCSQQY